MKAAYIVDDQEVAGILVDPMRRAILGFLAEKPMTQSQLADVLGLSDASLNYHMKKLRAAGLVTISKKVAEEHGIIQKFFSPVAYLFIYDLDALPKDISRYFYPISVERARGVVSAMAARNGRAGGGGSSNKPYWEDMAAVTETLSRLLVGMAKPYTRKDVQHGSEAIAYEIYARAVRAWLDRKDAAAKPRQRR
ncbi:helix-turn-helix domain-containing protein [Nitrososphaera sp.]|uniref:ArsR/SmtB family transcription factor n=1 Tax=Nitrososphaera sp. TaxID=1971748 RepID=UPI00307CF425